jgi:hypothetical protein
MLSGELAVLQAPMFDGLSLDPFTLSGHFGGRFTTSAPTPAICIAATVIFWLPQ